MFLKANINLELFFEAVRNCNGDVFFHSAEMDVLNLKSRLCLYLFTAAFVGGENQLSGYITLENEDDKQALMLFVE